MNGPPRKHFPKPRCHKGYAVIDVYDGGKRCMQTLGPWGSEKASIEYERVLARLRVGKPAVVPPAGGAAAIVHSDLNVAEALDRYNTHIERYFNQGKGAQFGDLFR